jgi:hypothetical protein
MAKAFTPFFGLDFSEGIISPALPFSSPSKSLFPPQIHSDFSYPHEGYTVIICSTLVFAATAVDVIIVIKILSIQSS